MDTRRFRKHRSSEALAQVRWLGWVMIMMFVLVQAATGGTKSRPASRVETSLQGGLAPTRLLSITAAPQGSPAAREGNGG
jgi:hypothetical protein